MIYARICSVGGIVLLFTAYQYINPDTERCFVGVISRGMLIRLSTVQIPSPEELSLKKNHVTDRNPTSVVQWDCDVFGYLN